MRSRTSRGVPEWSGGKDLYMGSCHTDTGKFRGHIGIVPGPPEGFRGSTRRGHPSRRASWAARGKELAPGGLGAPPWAHAPRVGGDPKGGAPPSLGGQAPSLAAPPSRSHLEGAGPLPPSPINRGARGGLHTTSKAQPLPSPTHLLLHVSLVKPCRRTATPSPPRRRAAVGALFLNLSFPLAGSRRRRRRPLRTCVERGGAVRLALGHR